MELANTDCITTSYETLNIKIAYKKYGMSEGKKFLSAMVFIEKENKQMLGRNIEIIAGIRVTCFQGEKNPKDLH